MSDNEQQPSTPQLTRRQLRELRNTASNPIIVDPDATDDAAAIGAEPAPAAAPLPRAAEPIEIPPAPVPQASVDLGSPALTRRQARLQEKIRTASIPVITATGEHPAFPAMPDATDDAVDAPGQDVDDTDTDTDAEAAADEATEIDADDSEQDAQLEDAEPGEAEADDADAATDAATAYDEIADDEPAAEKPAGEEPAVEEEPERHVVSNDLGADLLAGESSASNVPASFDQLLSRSAAATGAFTTPNALILAENPDGGPLVAPVTATGEVLITGTFSLPENFGSTGVVPGAADGKEVDAVLVDGELPASSSPTPIAASAAISTIKSAEDVIRPPAPEKGSRWTVALAITAGALALALAGVLLVSLFTGVFG